MQKRVATTKTLTRDKSQYGLIIAEKEHAGLTPDLSLELEEQAEVTQTFVRFFDPRGDEKRRGPTFNYARVFTYCQVIRTFEHTLQSTMQKISNRETCQGANNAEPPQGQDFLKQLDGHAEQIESYCGLGRTNYHIHAYPEWHEVPVFIWKGIAFSAGLSVYLQWGTTGAAMMIAYLTPTVGLGCRSGSYMIYGAAATVSWFLLAISSLFSHSAMLRHQREMQKFRLTADSAAHTPSDGARNINGTHAQANGDMELDQTSSRPEPNPPQTNSKLQSENRRSKWDWIPVRALAALTRYIGKPLAVANAFFLLAISLLEFLGGYENCWCKSVAAGLGSNGWIVLFKTPKDLEQAARIPWAMGVVFSILVCLSSFGVFWGAM